VGDSPLRGFYKWGNEIESFTPCGSSKTYWVEADPALLQQLRGSSASYSSAVNQAYQPIYVEVSGTLESGIPDGLAADYDGVYRFTEVHSISQSAPVGCGQRG
jgi:hypothetical protein